MTLNDLSSKYIKYVGIYCRPGTIKFVKQHLKSILNFFGDLNIDFITYDMVLDFIKEKQSNGLSNNTINKEIALLKRLYLTFELNCSFLKIKKLT